MEILFFLYLIVNLFALLIGIVFFVSVPRYLADIAHYLRQIFLYGYDLPNDNEKNT